jgi:hypothetical protein
MTTQKQGFADAAMLTTSVEQLDEVLRQPGATPRVEVAAAFDRLSYLVAALPRTTEEYCFAANWIDAAREDWAAGDPGAAHYQLQMVRKKLAGVRGRGAAGDVEARPLSDRDGPRAIHTVPGRTPISSHSHLTSRAPSPTRPFTGASS